MRGVKRPSHSNVMGASRPARGFYSIANRSHPAPVFRVLKERIAGVSSKGSTAATGRETKPMSVPRPGETPV